MDRAHEPGDVEAPRQVGQPGAARHQTRRRPRSPRARPRVIILGLTNRVPGRGYCPRPPCPAPGSRRPAGRRCRAAAACQRSQRVRVSRAFSPNCWAQRSISGTPIASVPELMADLRAVDALAVEAQQHTGRQAPGASNWPSPVCSVMCLYATIRWLSPDRRYQAFGLVRMSSGIV